MDPLPLHLNAEFKDYHHVIIDNCDLGLYMGNVDEPVDYEGQKLYFQGSRILKHVVDELNEEFPMTDVLFAGGSGGAQSVTVGADYIHSIMPKSVKRFGIAPINGYGQGSWEGNVKKAYQLHGMADHTPASCLEANAENPYACIKPSEAYKYSNVNMFMVQIFDHTFEYANNPMLGAWTQCMGRKGAPTRFCSDENAKTLAEYFSEFVWDITRSPKFGRRGQGGFLSTCAKHNFYNYEGMFNTYATEGVTAGDAIASWWQSLETDRTPHWYLPCHLGHTVAELQCEPSCGR